MSRLALTQLTLPVIDAKISFMKGTKDLFPNSEAAILDRLLDREFGGLPANLARRFLATRFSREDVKRVNTLSARAREGRLTPQENDELENYLRVGSFLSIIKSKARQSLKKHELLRDRT